VQDANRKTHQQVERVNNMVTSVLDNVAELPNSLSHAIEFPLQRGKLYDSRQATCRRSVIRDQRRNAACHLYTQLGLGERPAW
jgi:hypothetical protein